MAPIDGGKDGSAALDVSLEDRGQQPVVIARGSVDPESADRLAGAIERARLGTPGPVVVDLSAVDFISSAGLNVLLKAETVARGDGRHLILLDPSPPVLKLLEVTGLSERFALSAVPAQEAARRWREAADRLDYWLANSRRQALSPADAEELELAQLSEREWWAIYQVHRARGAHFDEDP